MILQTLVFSYGANDIVFPILTIDLQYNLVDLWNSKISKNTILIQQKYIFHNTTYNEPAPPGVLNLQKCYSSLQNEIQRHKEDSDLDLKKYIYLRAKMDFLDREAHCKFEFSNQFKDRFYSFLDADNFRNRYKDLETKKQKGEKDFFYKWLRHEVENSN